MPLKDILYHALIPHKAQLQNWSFEEITDLFLGFGNISIYFTSDENHKDCDNLAGSYRYNGECIADALELIGLEEKFGYLDFYWNIAAAAGDGIREDLNDALQTAGFTVYEYYHSDLGDEILTPIPTLKGMKTIN